MKKLLFFFVVLCSLQLSARNYNRYVTFNVISGVNKSRFINYDGSTGRIGSVNNINLRIGRTQFVQFNLELSIYQSKAPQVINASEILNQYNFGYFTFPVMYGYRLGFNESKSYAVRFYGGPEMGLLLWVKDRQNVLNSGNVNKILFNAMAGIGLDFKRLTVDFGFHQAMSNAYTIKTKWQVLSLTTGWKF
jgi:hypothetical protein